MNNTDKMLRLSETLMLSMPDYISEWYFNLRAGGKTPATCYAYLCMVNEYMRTIKEDVSSITLDELKYVTVARYLVAIKNKKDRNGNKVETSHSYQNTVWYAMNSLFTFLSNMGYIEKNPVGLISKVKNNDLDRINQTRILLTEDDFKNIIKVVKTNNVMHYPKWREKFISRDISIFILFMTTGMRRTALTNINLNDVDLNNNIIKIKDKGNKVLYFNISDELSSYIFDWIRSRDNIASNNNALFISRTGERLSTNAIYNMVERYSSVALGRKVSPHKLRSGFISILYNRTGDIEFCRRAVHHSSTSITQRYIVTDNAESTKASNIISDILNNT